MVLSFTLTPTVGGGDARLATSPQTSATASSNVIPSLSSLVGGNPSSPSFSSTQVSRNPPTLSPNVGGGDTRTTTSPETSASSVGSNNNNNNNTAAAADNTSAPPFSATEALQAALTSRYASSRLQQVPSQQGRATAALQAATESHVVMCTIGFGIDTGHGGNSSWDATEASVRALRDAMERSTLRLPYLQTLSDAQLQLHVKLGVPPKALQPTEPMLVDMAAVTAVLPRSIPLDLPIQVVVGGLAVPGLEGGEPPVCAAIASVSIQTVPDTVAPAQRAMEQSPWATQLASQDAQEDEKKLAAKPVDVSSTNPLRVDSMSMLAQIAGTVRDNPSMVGGNESPLAAAVAAARRTKERSRSMDTMSSTESSSHDEEVQHSHHTRQRKGKTPKRKLRPSRPGLTGKKNKRQFVEHNYHDHANDVPIAGESATGPIGVENIAFPFKMHDTLSRIEADGYSDIMSWMPHGRSFKIHDLDGFHANVLPVYFRTAKKSSLLRQLNLYGFRRICAGPDKGSYYHELFLRGKRFLCGRMRRVKVNGKRIRSAGNPETEPVFATMDPMPLVNAPILHIHTVSSDVSEEEEEDDPYMEDDAGEEDGVGEEDASEEEAEDVAVGPKSYDALSFPFKLHALLDLLDLRGETGVISWLPHGRAFRVHNPDAFVRLLMPRYFEQSKYTSFQRQLALYGFVRITGGVDKGAYYHSSFLRGMPRLCQEMRRTRVKGEGGRKPSDHFRDPEFHCMPPIASVQPALLELPLEMPEISPTYALAMAGLAS